MFAFVLIDLVKNEIYLVRDRIGIKPHYFSLQQDMLSFSSEIKALWKFPWNKKVLCNQALYHYLTFMVTPAPYTLYENVYKLPAGFYAKLDSSRFMSFYQWYSPLKPISLQEKKQLTDERYCAERVQDLLCHAVKKRMMADVPVGAFLSGGIDSSLNVALMAQCKSTIKTFTVAFDDDPSNNELKWARLVAKQFGTEHHEITISEKEAFEFYQKMVYHLDEPLADCVCIPFYYVAALAKKYGVTVAQVGEGADELFAGYPLYLRYKNFYERLWRPSQLVFPAFVRRGMQKTFQNLFRSRPLYQELLKNWAYDRSLLWSGAVAFTEQHKKNLLSPNMREKRCYDPIVKKIYPELRQEYDSYAIVDYHRSRLRSVIKKPDFFQEILFLELGQRIPELLLMRADKMSMAASLEARVPYLDHQLVEFMLHVPDSVKVKNNVSKWLLKQVAKKFLPQAILDRKKLGFGAPTARWFDQGSFFPAYFEKMSRLSGKGQMFFPKMRASKNFFDTVPAIRAVQMWTLQNLWSIHEN